MNGYEKGRRSRLAVHGCLTLQQPPSVQIGRPPKHPGSECSERLKNSWSSPACLPFHLSIDSSQGPWSVSSNSFHVRVQIHSLHLASKSLFFGFASFLFSSRSASHRSRARARAIASPQTNDLTLVRRSVVLLRQITDLEKDEVRALGGLLAGSPGAGPAARTSCCCVARGAWTRVQILRCWPL